MYQTYLSDVSGPIVVMETRVFLSLGNIHCSEVNRALGQKVTEEKKNPSATLSAFLQVCGYFNI